MNPETLYTYALTLFGIPYQWGGNGPWVSGDYGFDCSGFIQHLLKKAKVTLPPGDYTADGLHKYFKGRACPYVGQGALAFFGTSDRTSHVGLMINSQIMISAAGGGPSCVNHNTANRMCASVKIQPVAWWKAPPLLECLMPSYPDIRVP